MIPSWMAGIHRKLLVNFWRAKLHRHIQLQWQPLTALPAYKQVPSSYRRHRRMPTSAGRAHNDLVLLLLQSSLYANSKLLMTYVHQIASSCFRLQGCLGCQAHVEFGCSCLFSSAQVECRSSGLLGMHNHWVSNLYCPWHFSMPQFQPNHDADKTCCKY